MRAGSRPVWRRPLPLPGGTRRRLDIAGITADSRRVAPGYLFAALPGSRADGRAFIADAVSRGAVAVLAPDGHRLAARRAAASAAGGSRAAPAPRAARRRRWPAAQPRVVVAVTGTNGKTSTVEFLRQLWAAGGKPAASLGTLGLIAPGFDPGPGLTTPDPVSLAETLARLARAGIQHAAMEASSHGLDQFRLDGVRLAAAAFTNLTRDHLDYHGSEDAYRAAKLRLFAELLPAGAPGGGEQRHGCRRRSTALRRDRRAAAARSAHGRRGRIGDPAAGGAAASRRPGPAHRGRRASGARSRCRCPAASRPTTPCWPRRWPTALGERDALDRLAALHGVRGRLELAARLPNGAAVYVDYAHTPDALERLLTALRPHTAGRLHVVFGAGGDRDRGKRPLMGAAAARLADVAIVTDDNPRSEDPAAIRAAMLAACPGGREIGDRARAIAAALNGLGAGDVLAVAGKGHEQGQTIGDDRASRSTTWRSVRRLVGARSQAHDPRSGPRTICCEATGGTHGDAVRRHRRVDRHAHARSRAICSSPCAARTATATPSSPTRSPRARPARWCIATCRTPAACCWSTTRWPACTASAATRAQRFTGRLVAVTGSVGKTTTKEMLRTHPVGIRPHPCRRRLLQQPLGRAADAGAHAAGRRVLRRRDRHEPSPARSRRWRASRGRMSR